MVNRIMCANCATLITEHKFFCQLQYKTYGHLKTKNFECDIRKPKYQTPTQLSAHHNKVHGTVKTRKHKALDV